MVSTAVRKLFLDRTPNYLYKILSGKFARLLFIGVAVTLGLLYFTQPGWAAVTYLDFTTNSLDDSVLIEWWTASEEDNEGFYIGRALQASGIYERVSPFFTSEADEGSGAYYYYFDDTALPGVLYYYRLEAIAEDGAIEYYGPITGSVVNPSVTATTVRTVTPTRTSTSLPTSINEFTSTPSPTGQNINTATTTPARNQAGTAFTPTITGTITAVVLETNTPTVTTTLEPLPVIQLTFPATQTPPPVVPTAISRSLPTPTPEPASGAESSLSPRLVVLGMIIALLWVCLGAFLVIMVRKIEE